LQGGSVGKRAVAVVERLGCQYAYNLSASALEVGTYRVAVIIQRSGCKHCHLRIEIRRYSISQSAVTLYRLAAFCFASRSPLFELALVLVRLDHVACVIVDANDVSGYHDHGCGVGRGLGVGIILGVGVARVGVGVGVAVAVVVGVGVGVGVELDVPEQYLPPVLK